MFEPIQKLYQTSFFQWSSLWGSLYNSGYEKVSELKKLAFEEEIRQVVDNYNYSSNYSCLGYFRYRLNNAQIKALLKIDGVHSIGKFEDLNIPKLLIYRQNGNTELIDVFNKDK